MTEQAATPSAPSAQEPSAAVAEEKSQPTGLTTQADLGGTMDESAGGEPSASPSEYLSDEEWASLSKKKRKLKIDNEDTEMTLAEIERNTAINKSVTKRGQEAAERAKLAEERENSLKDFLEEAKANPRLLWALAEKFGHDPDALAIERARQAYEWSQLTDEEKENRVAKMERDQLRAEKEEREAELRQTAEYQEAQEVETEIQSDIEATIAEMKLSSPDAVDIERIVQATQFLYNRLERKPTPQEVAQFVLPKLGQDVKRYLQSVGPEQLSELLGREALDKLQSHVIKQAESKNLPFAPSKRTSAEDKKPAVRKEIGVNEFFKNL